MKLEKQRSAMLTLILCMIVLIGLIVATVTLPWLWHWVVMFFDREQEYHVITLGFMYGVCALGDIASVMLVVLVMRVLHGQVFTDISISLLRGVSWCCMLVAPLFFAIGFWYCSMFVPAFVAFFCGLALRVMKNVIEQATVIKAEHDLTV